MSEPLESEYEEPEPVNVPVLSITAPTEDEVPETPLPDLPRLEYPVYDDLDALQEAQRSVASLSELVR